MCPALRRLSARLRAAIAGNLPRSFDATAAFSAGEPNCETLAIALRACAGSFIGYLRAPGSANELDGSALRAFAVSTAMFSSWFYGGLRGTPSLAQPQVSD
jgi:hypothetical protein